MERQLRRTATFADEGGGSSREQLVGRSARVQACREIYKHTPLRISKGGEGGGADISRNSFFEREGGGRIAQPGITTHRPDGE